MSGIGPGARVGGRYVVLEELGRGGMGVVYLARDEDAAREVALKVLHQAPHGEAKRRLQREARATSTLDPRGVAKVLEIGRTSGGELYLAMEYVRGDTLRALQRKGRVDRAEALRIVSAVATTLGEAHRAGLVHRDVKPENIIVCEDGRVVLLDFGIVKHVGAGQDTAHVSTQLTSEGSVIGTPAYLSPEQALGREVGPESDQFALGVTAFELLTGRLPWTATEVTTILAQVLAEPAPRASSVDTELAPAFDHVLSRALSKNVARRFRTIDEFAQALRAADRGEYVPFEESPTIAVPMAAPRDRPRAVPRRWRWPLAFFALAAAGAVVGLSARRRLVFTPAGSAKDSVESAVLALAGADAKLACPILEARGVPDVAGHVGAAAATLVCLRANWYLGGGDDRVLPPAALLGVPVEAVPDALDPYTSPDQRSKAIDLARAGAKAYVDGSVTHAGDSWQVSLVLRAPDGGEVRHAEAQDAAFSVAVARATEALWTLSLVRRAIDPIVSRWTSFPDAATGLAFTDLVFGDSAEGCGAIRRRARDLGNAFFSLESKCEQWGVSSDLADAGAPVLDESSPAALVASAPALADWNGRLPLDEDRRLAMKLESLRGLETSRFARARLGAAAGHLWEAANEPERAHAASFDAVREDPLTHNAWITLVVTAAATGTRETSAATARTWFPCETTFLVKAGSYRGDELELRLREARLANLLEPGLERAMHLGRALAEAGRADEAAAVAAAPVEDEESSRVLKAFVAAFVDLRDARLGSAMRRLEEAGNIGITDLIDVARVAGHPAETATAWATRFLALSDDRADVIARGYHAPMTLCMTARPDLAKRCLDRISRLGHATMNFWGDGGDALLSGAMRYASGDLHAAVSLWRPLVAGPTTNIARVLPTDAFERAGQPELAARLDARKLPYTFIAGVSEAAPREAKRLVARGENAKGVELAKKVVAAWEGADLIIPAVAEMKDLIKRAE